MAQTTFNTLSHLVLVDIMASLPLDQVIRMFSLGRRELRRVCSLKWVLRRMTNVTFSTLTRYVYINKPRGDSLKRVFSKKVVLRRLHGYVQIDFELLCRGYYPSYFDHCVDLLNRIPGRHLLDFRTSEVEIDYEIEGCLTDRLIKGMDEPEKIAYIVYDGYESYYGMNRLPNLVLTYDHDIHLGSHSVEYRISLLKGRHVLDVLRAVNERNLKYINDKPWEVVRKEVEENAKEGCIGVWNTRWENYPVEFSDDSDD